ncbi:MAG: hypothetical protein JJ956_16570 [Pseudomonadales bacterium]|nr:hypothetical protein [Pseudomonadales bacterium]
MVVPEEFDFEKLDDLSFALDRGKKVDKLPRMQASDISPVAELFHYREKLSSTDFLLGNGQKFFNALASEMVSWSDPIGRSSGFLRASLSDAERELAQVKFQLETQKAAVESGFHKSIAVQFAATVGEFFDNIIEHSESRATGFVAYQGMENKFEIVASDEGIGVLASLKSASEFSSLCDHGSALNLVLTDGVSRFGSSSGRGRGFRPIFVGLANLKGRLRFRTGDHALTMDGKSINKLEASLSQKPEISGFTISVNCDNPYLQ